MELLITISSLGLGGAEKQAVELANHFAQRGVNVHFAILRGGNASKLTFHPSVTLNENIIPSSRSRLQNKLNKLLAVRWLSRYIQQQQLRNVIAFLDEAIVVCAGAAYITRPRPRFVACQVYVFSNNRFSFSALNDRILKRALQTADNIIAVSSLVKNSLLDKLPLASGRIKTINNSVNYAQLEQLSLRTVPTQLLAENFILAVGRLDPIKRYDVLLCAFSKLINHYPDLKLVIIGEGSDRERLESQVLRLGLQDAASLLGATDNPYPAMRRAKMLVVCSESEGFGTVILESIVCGTPVVSNARVGAAVDIKDFHQYGVLYDSGSPDALCSAMIECLEDFGEREIARLGSTFDEPFVFNEYYTCLFGLE